jgi:tRNA threonylcarbamoyladenosine biosynthesis protein TsaB
VIILALDTCDSRGSVAVLRDEEVLKAIAHEGTTEYSIWLLPTVAEALKSARLEMRDVELFAVASGPGSFTGVRMGLTTVKAWSEVYGKGIASVSRLESMASEAPSGSEYVAAFFDAHRDQLYAGLFLRQGATLRLVEEEMVAAPADFISWVGQRAQKERVSWISMDPEKMTAHAAWQERASVGESVEASNAVLAPAIGRIGRLRALEGRLTDVLKLDAEYVRRPDAEVFWKDTTSRAR